MRTPFFLGIVGFTACGLLTPTPVPDAGGEIPDVVASKFQTLTVTWSIKTSSGAPATCPANYGFIRVAASGFSTLDTANGDDFWGVFPCSAGRGTLRLQTAGDEDVKPNADGSLPRTPNRNITGRYRVTLAISEMSGESEYEIALESREVDLSTGDKTLAFDVTPGASLVQPEWALEAVSTQAKVSCAAGDVDTIRIKYKRVAEENGTPVATSVETVQTVPCGSSPATGQRISCTYCLGAATSVPLTFGRYLLALEALKGTTVVGRVDYADPSRANSELITIERTSARLIKGGGPTRVEVWRTQPYTIPLPNR